MGIYYLRYSHWSQFWGFGSHLLGEVRTVMKADKFDEWQGLFKKLRIVTNNDTPTKEDIAKCQPYCDKEALQRSGYNWHTLLAKSHCSFEKILQSGYMCRVEFEDEDFTSDLGIEYIYILDFDSKTLVIHYNKGDEDRIVEEFDLYHLPSSFDQNGEHTYDEEAPILK